MNTKLTKIISGLFIATAAFQTASAGNITDIKVSSLPNKQKIIKVSFDKEVVSPTGFVTSSPARIALDFEQTGISMDQQVLEYADSLLNKISAAQNSNRARLVLNLNKPSQYNTEVRGNEVWILINESSDTTSAPVRAAVQTMPQTQPSAPFSESVVSVSAPFSPAAAQQTAAMPAKQTNIDFRKDSKNAGIVELAALGFSGQPDIRQQRDRVIITLKNHTLTTAQQRSLDVADFKTPVQNVTLKRINNDTQLIIKMTGNWEFINKSASAGRFTFQILPKKQNIESNGLNNAPKVFKGRKISLDFQDVEVRTILQILAKESGTNIVASDTVNGKMTLSLKDVPWDQALDLVMQARNLDMRQQGNIINIAPRDELLAKDKAFLQAEKEIAELGSLYSQNFQLKYKNVEEFRKILRLDEIDTNNTRNTLLSNRGSALIDPATNTLIVTDTRSVIEKFRKLIDELDVPAQQVMIEARIVEATDGFARDLGVKFGYGGTERQTAWGFNSGSGGISAANNGGAGGNIGTSSGRWSVNTNINLPVAAAANSIALVRALSSGALNLELSASEQLSKTKTLANPRVLTQNRQEAKIESGTEIPYQDTSTSGNNTTTTTTFKKAVLGLVVTPNITPDGQIIMNVKINKDTPIDCRVKNEATKCIQTKNLDTQAMVENGGTLIVGGIYEEENGNTLTKIPLLGDIPVIGNLFKTRQNSQSRRELLIFITPRIMDTVGSNLRY
ncbi:type IV pilus secretin PilQ [Neisseria cinerea]|uniref:type IV pilus secretin PilQ n=1 Tax=Neisseria cinerea TaxID=483 RepID=UPI002B1E46EF|nr:type IV pilus secretin PilQ [Neisseria cinerea]